MYIMYNSIMFLGAAVGTGLLGARQLHASRVTNNSPLSRPPPCSASLPPSLPPFIPPSLLPSLPASPSLPLSNHLYPPLAQSLFLGSP